MNQSRDYCKVFTGNELGQSYSDCIDVATIQGELNERTTKIRLIVLSSYLELPKDIAYHIEMGDI